MRGRPAAPAAAAAARGAMCVCPSIECVLYVLRQLFYFLDPFKRVFNVVHVQPQPNARLRYAGENPPSLL